jgi:aryl-alcohol dehydrogenase-like predicted oxidoreductase
MRPMSFQNRTLGRTGLAVSPLALATGGGALPPREVERAFERGVRTFYFGSLRSPSFAEGVRALVPKHRDQMILVVQSYTRAASLMKMSLERGLKKLGADHAELFLLGWWNEPPPARILEAALALKERGLAKHLMISCHNRKTFAQYAADPSYGAIMVRYNAVHPGAESDVFPLMPPDRPGIASYTALRWGHLLDPNLMPKEEPHPRASDCYRFVLTNPSVDLSMCAPRNTSELDEALTAIERGAMKDEELAWMKRVGAHVKKATEGRRAFSPIEVLDRVAKWMAPNDGAGLDTSRD